MEDSEEGGESEVENLLEKLPYNPLAHNCWKKSMTYRHSMLLGTDSGSMDTTLLCNIIVIDNLTFL